MRLAATGLTLAISTGPLAACADRPAGVSAVPITPAASYSEQTDAIFRYHSVRLRLSLAVPGPEWTINDRLRSKLVAIHAPTSSRITVAVLRTDDLVGRHECETRARAAGLTTAANLRVIDDEVAVTQGSFDTRIAVGLEPRRDEHAPLVGHVLAFGGFLRKCYVFDYSTEVPHDEEEPVLSSRLAFARTRILNGLELDAVAGVSEPPAGTAKR